MEKLKELLEENNQLKEKIHYLDKENDELKYQLRDLQESVDIANDEYAREMQRMCGCITIEGARKSAAYQDMVGILLSNGYCVEIKPIHHNTKLMLVIKESEDTENE